ncbi:unnamed protein product [Adineta ricciae]|uniref:Sodefrin repeats C n=1 Tax=Adineta ricciae TaxID=249248 RepID=A0A814SVY6_ADIRI|nr:unnamed protein product [Adineta ricciae]CAF1455008.1 unnamed protein product [Adineta ricciae]
MQYSLLIVLSLLILAIIYHVNGLQCYKCSCTAASNGTGCQNDDDLQCVIEYVENNYCIINRTSSNNIIFGHRTDADLMFLENLHYLRAKEQISYVESSSTWQAPVVTEFTYGCDWSLCNSPRILSYLPKGLTFSVDPNVLTATLIPAANESLTTCLNCTRCVNSTGALVCATPMCSGTCFIDDLLDNPTVNDASCLFAFQSVCLPEKRTVAVEITGTYYIDNDDFQLTEIDMWCQSTNCNDPIHIQTIQKEVTYLTQFNDQIYFRPDTTTAKPADGLRACYKCHCEHEIGNDTCKVLECTIEYKNNSYCEIVRDFKSFEGMEFIVLGHVDRAYVPYKHFIHAEEEQILYKNLTWHPPSIKLISYICDWDLCNDGRLVEKLTTSFQFDAEPSEIAAYLESSETLTSCMQCEVCTNSTLDSYTCPNSTCSSSGRCFIAQYIDHAEYQNCEYAFYGECENSVMESSIIITATYNIDDDILNFEEVDVYCSKNGCNRPETVYSLIELIDENIQLDSLFFFRPVSNTTTPPIITEPTPSITTTRTATASTMSTTSMPSSAPTMAMSSFMIMCAFVLCFFSD